MYNTQADYNKRVEQIATWLKAASQGSYLAQANLKEAAISTSDFPSVFTDIKTAQLQAKYDLVTNRNWQKIARKVTVPNFLPQSFIDLGWDDSAFSNILATNGGYDTTPGTLPNVPEATEYPTAFKLYSSEEQLSIRKAGTRIPFTFEAIINDQWGIVDDLPQWMLRTALDSEEVEVTKLLTDGDGPNSVYFNNTNKNLLVYGTNTNGQAQLTRDTLKQALFQANHFKTGPNSNRPVRFSKFALVVPPSLEGVANDLVNTPRQFLVTDGATQYTATFDYGANFEVVVEDWLEVIDTVHGSTAWYVVPFAGEGVRAALGLGFLQNHEAPELRVHNQTGVYLGGGAVPLREGSFLNDTWEMRLRHIYGAIALNGGIGTVASSGQAAPTV
jgi:hypothetical protein